MKKHSNPRAGLTEWFVHCHFWLFKLKSDPRRPLLNALRNKDMEYIQNQLPRTLVSTGVYDKCVKIATEYGAKSLDYLPTQESGGRILKELVNFTLNQTKSVERNY